MQHTDLQDVREDLRAALDKIAAHREHREIRLFTEIALLCLEEKLDQGVRQFHTHTRGQLE